MMVYEYLAKLSFFLSFFLSSFDVSMSPDVRGNEFLKFLN